MVVLLQVHWYEHVGAMVPSKEVLPDQLAADCAKFAWVLCKTHKLLDCVKVVFVTSVPINHRVWYRAFR